MIRKAYRTVFLKSNAQKETRIRFKGFLCRLNQARHSSPMLLWAEARFGSRSMVLRFSPIVGARIRQLAWARLFIGRPASSPDRLSIAELTPHLVPWDRRFRAEPPPLW